jgi:hypothetical protein
MAKGKESKGGMHGSRGNRTTARLHLHVALWMHSAPDPKALQPWPAWDAPPTVAHYCGLCVQCPASHITRCPAPLAPFSHAQVMLLEADQLPMLPQNSERFAAYLSTLAERLPDAQPRALSSVLWALGTLATAHDVPLPASIWEPHLVPLLSALAAHRGTPSSAHHFAVAMGAAAKLWPHAAHSEALAGAVGEIASAIAGPAMLGAMGQADLAAALQAMRALSLPSLAAAQEALTEALIARVQGDERVDGASGSSSAATAAPRSLPATPAVTAALAAS